MGYGQSTAEPQERYFQKIKASGSLIDQNSSLTNIYICGQTQTGKSTLIKRLSRQSVRTGDGYTSCTKSITPYLCDGGVDIVLIDSPGLCDSDGSNEERRILKDVQKQMQNKSLNLFCFVVQKGVFNASVQATIKKLQYIFSQEGDQDFKKFCFIVTHVDIDSNSNNPEETYPQQQRDAIDEYHGLVEHFFGARIPKIWAISMEEIEVQQDPKTPIEQAVALVNTAKRTAVDKAFAEFKA